MSRFLSPARVGGLALLLALAPVVSQAHDAKHHTAQGEECHCAKISNPWSRATAPGAANGAAFMTITNDTDQDEKLIAAATPVSATAELHTHVHDNGVMRMRQVPEIVIPARQSVTLQPGGLHVMLMGLKAPLAEGATVPLTLTFKTAGAITVEVPVQGAGAMGGPQGGMGHGTMEHGSHGQPK